VLADGAAEVGTDNAVVILGIRRRSEFREVSMKHSVLHARVEHAVLVYSNMRRVVALKLGGTASGTGRSAFYSILQVSWSGHIRSG
jgi:hypothetical protein